MSESQIESVRASLKIAQAWGFLGLPGRPSKSCHSPFRDDARESFSVYVDKGGLDRWFDHALGRGGDVVDLWMAARGFLSTKEALADILRERPSLSAYQTPSGNQNAPNRPLEAGTVVPAIRWPADLRLPLEAECRELGRLRGLLPDAFDIAARLGCLKVATMAGVPVWIITDAAGLCGEARRFDGLPFVTPKGKKIKAFALTGSRKNQPVGMVTERPEYDRLKKVLLVEGGPDYFAGLTLAIDSPIAFRVATMLGSLNIENSDDMKTVFRDTNVIIIPHNDTKGCGAAQARAECLISLGASHVKIKPLPFEVDDLNDFLSNGQPSTVNLLEGFKDELPKQRKTAS